MKNILLNIFQDRKNQGLDSHYLREMIGEIEAPTYDNYKISSVELRKLICELRNEGHIIIAGQKGYMLTNDREKITKYLKSRWCEVCREMKQFRIMAKSCDMIDQLTIWESENGEI